MPRSGPLTDAELFDATLLLRQVTSLDEWKERVAAFTRRFFACDGSAAWYLTGGRLQMAAEGFSEKLWTYDIEGVYGEYLKLDPALIRAAGLTVNHISDIYRQFDGMTGIYADYWAEFGCDHQVTCVLFEDDVFAGVVAAVQKLNSGDFSPYDVDAMHAIYPHIQAGFLECAAYTRTLWFGPALTSVIDEYPFPLLILKDGDERPVYANRAAQRWMQSTAYEPEARIPVAARSQTVADVLAAVAEGRPEIPRLAARVEIVPLPDWPRLGLESPKLVLLEPIEAGPTPAITGRQHEVLAAAASHPRLRDAAEQLGITVMTLQTHLRDIYRRLGVSGLSEAITLSRLCQSAPAAFDG